MILDEVNIKKQHFHGGAMNGVCCRRLLDNVEALFEDIRKLGMNRLKQKKIRKDKDEEKLTVVLEDFYQLFETIDLIFSLLRVLAPTDQEIEAAATAIKVLEVIWEQIDMNKTPKAHILFNHTIDQVRRFGGIADMAEDFVEKSHQTGKRLDHLIARMSSQCFRQQELVKIRRQWLSNDPSVLKQMQCVAVSSKRAVRTTNSPKRKKGAIKKEAKILKREKVVTKSYFLSNSSTP